VEMLSRASNAVLTDDSREARDIEISLGGVVEGSAWGFCRDLGRESQDAPDLRRNGKMDLPC
jgi:hypothetical protein